MRPSARGSLAVAREANVRRLRLMVHARRVHGFGPRVLFELLDELARDTRRRPLIERRTAEFAGIDPRALAITGGDHLPEPLVRVVAGREP